MTTGILKTFRTKITTHIHIKKNPFGFLVNTQGIAFSLNLFDHDPGNLFWIFGDVPVSTHGAHDIFKQVLIKLVGTCCGQILENNLGADALPQFHADTEAHMAAFNRTARTLYDNFMATTGLK